MNEMANHGDSRAAQSAIVAGFLFMLPAGADAASPNLTDIPVIDGRPWSMRSFEGDAKGLTSVIVLGAGGNGFLSTAGRILMLSWRRTEKGICLKAKIMPIGERCLTFVVRGEIVDGVDGDRRVFQFRRQ